MNNIPVAHDCCTNAPPLGLKPRYIHDHARKVDILDAMARYEAASATIPLEWIEELRDIVVREHERKASK